MNIDFNKIIERSKAVLTNPKGVWGEIKAEPANIGGIYQQYVFVLAAIGPIASFVGTAFLGLGFLFIPSLVTLAIGYGLALAGVYIMAMILEFLVPHFEGQADRVSIFKLVVFASVPNYVGGILGIVPALAPLAILFSLYAIYTFWCGVTPMTGVPENKKLIFVIVSAIVAVVVFAVLGTITAAVACTGMMGGAIATGAATGAFSH